MEDSHLCQIDAWLSYNCKKQTQNSSNF